MILYHANGEVVEFPEIRKRRYTLKAAVSYTHLDVYKRQEVKFDEKIISKANKESSSAVWSNQEFEIINAINMLSEEFNNDVTAVSYTHLNINKNS